jgi:hypothetical protein
MASRALSVAGFAVRPHSHRWEWVARWCLIVTFAELAGFAVPAAIGVATAASSAAVALPAVVVAGAVEGALLGAGQALVLGPVLPALHRLRWVMLTAAAAMVAYAFGMGPSTWASGVFDAPTGVQIVAGAVIGTIVLASIGGLQWLELRRRVPGAAHWIWITATAWLVALAAFMAIATPLWQPGQPLWLAIGIGVMAGAVMAAIQAFGTGWGMARLLDRGGRI